MKKQIKVNLFGATGKRQIDITSRGGFPTRHIKAPREVGGEVSSQPSDCKEGESPCGLSKDPATLNSVSAPAPSSKTPTETKKSPVNPKSDAFPAPTLLEVLKWMEASENHTGWLIIDEILYVATTQYKMKFNHNTLLDALRFLFQKGCLEHRLNRLNQHMFRLIEKQTPKLKALLAEVDAIMDRGKEHA